MTLIEILNERKIPYQINESGHVSVEGLLDLSGCTSLTSLPENLSVSEWLDIADAIHLRDILDEFIKNETKRFHKQTD